MDFPRIFLILCGFILLICLALSLTSLTVLRNAVSETEALRTEMTSWIAAGAEPSALPVVNDTGADGDTVETDVLYDVFCVREVNGKIGIYTSDGCLIRLLDVCVATLPEKERQALSEGICVCSWRELIALMQDYSG